MCIRDSKCVYCQRVWKNEPGKSTPSQKQNMGQIRAMLKKHHGIECRLWNMHKNELVSRAEHILAHVCDLSECRDYSSNGCLKQLACGHMCCGVVGEVECPPCLEVDCASESELPVRDDFCNMCWVADLGSAPCIVLGCGHVFHAHCIRGQLQKGYSGARITFGHLGCPSVSYTHLRAHETVLDLVCRLLLEKKK
eukprot:TRINITY_DN7289_c0_g1_i1.p2 TRINITY_DN7289_c0_g1~~TRINITY_DN7289_c0_g1_i1.p2  ORF type:complete len:195 (+),score=50.13 TRINITY_DN7289_c0_g1_i1:166-750(+)